MTREQLAQLRATAEAATQGPWAWFGNSKVHSIYLATTNQGRRFVMQFARWGMRNAAPVFQRYGESFGLMVHAKEMVEHRSSYSKDIVGIDNPDARHIATFDPPTVLALLDEIERLRGER